MFSYARNCDIMLIHIRKYPSCKIVNTDSDFDSGLNLILISVPVCSSDTTLSHTHASRNCFCAVSLKSIYLRHLNKRVMRASIVENVCLMLPKHEKAILLPLLWPALKRFFTPFFSRGSIWETKLKQSSDNRICAFGGTQKNEEVGFDRQMTFV